MGEAKRKRVALREAMLKETESWMFPASDWEAQVIGEITKLPVLIVQKAPAEAIAYMRMPGRECHANCRWYAENDPEGKARHVAGWLVRDGGVYVLHSVVERDGGMTCLTPFQFGDETHIEFIPDEALEWRETDDGYRTCFRNGRRVGVGVRLDPAKTIADLEEARKRLLAGGDPMQAMFFPA